MRGVRGRKGGVGRIARTSPHLSQGLATTATSAIEGWRCKAFSTCKRREGGMEGGREGEMEGWREEMRVSLVSVPRWS